MLELHLNVWIYNPIVRTYIQGDMHDGGEGGLHPPPYMEILGDLESRDS